MSSSIGDMIRISIFGESHSKGIGLILEGIPAGEEVDMDAIGAFMARRRPGKDSLSTSRNESDEPIILSGILNSRTTGTPISILIENKDTRSEDYSDLLDKPRPSHADFPAIKKFGQAHDIRGGGHFSGRLTAPLCFAGALCSQILERKGVNIGAHIYSIGDVQDNKMDLGLIQESAVNLLNKIKNKDFPVLSDEQGKKMQDEIMKVKSEADSIGGVVECFILGLDPGIGEPIFDGLENNLSKAIFGIPAVKGIEFGAGFEVARMKGSENNDEFFVSPDGILTKSNNAGGLLGGLTTGMPVVFRVAIKPTASIGKKQNTISLSQNSDTELLIEGRHDPCIVPRALPGIEAAAAITILDLIYKNGEHDNEK